MTERKSDEQNVHNGSLTEKPGYAVLVVGEWGIGKTYQIKESLKEDEYYYVSLYGIQDSASIHAEVVSSWIKGKNDSTIRKLVSEGVQSISRSSESAGGAPYSSQ